MRCLDTRGGETAICLEVAWVSEPCDLLDMVKGEYLLPLRGQLGSCRDSSGKRVVVFFCLVASAYCVTAMVGARYAGSGS